MSRLSMHETQRLLIDEPAWLVAVGARLWVTRERDPADHVLGVGERLYVERGDRLILGPFDRGVPAGWQWQRTPRVAAAQALRRRVAGAAFAAAARVLRGAAGGLAALARSAAAMASRAQGCIRPGDSMASAGTVQ